MARCSKNAAARFIAAAGPICRDYQDEMLRALPYTRLEIDELWSFIYAKKKNVPEAKSPPRGAGDAYTWTATCADTRLLVTWRIGDRSLMTGLPFIEDLRSRLTHRVQLTSDGHKPYLQAIHHVFGRDIDYAQLVKVPRDQMEVESAVAIGSPDLDLISTSYAERSNLTVRMGSGGTRGRPTRSRRSWRTTGTASRCGASGTISGGFTRR